MPSTLLFIAATLLLSLNLVRPFGLAISDWLFFGALGLALLETISVTRRHSPCWWRNRFLWAVALILFGAVLSTMNSRAWSTALVEIFQQVFVMTFFTSLAWIMVRRGKTVPILHAFVLSGVFTSGVVLVDYLSGSRLGATLSGTPSLQLWGRFAGTLGHPNKLGYFLVLTSLPAISQLLSLKPLRSSLLPGLLWAAAIAVQVFGIYLSGSMTAYLGLLAGVLALLIGSQVIFVRTARATAILAGGGILALALILVPQLVSANRLPDLEDNSFARAITRVQTSTAESRLTVYDQAWDQIARNPWLGVGYDQISTSGISAASRRLDYSIHNTLLQIWYTGGLFAFVGWLAIYVLVGWMALRAILAARRNALSPLILGLAAGALSILLMDQFQDAIYQREKWLVIGLMAGVAWEWKQPKQVSQAEGEVPA